MRDVLKALNAHHPDCGRRPCDCGLTPVGARRDIRTTVTTTDHFSESRRFVTLAGASRYAIKRLGRHPDISVTFGYAVGPYGDVKLTVRGATLAELFPDTTG